MNKAHLNDMFRLPPESRAIEAITRFASVKRWHMIDTTKTQSVAEHSANVALLARYIAATAPGVYFGNPASVAGYALVHDLEEVFTGDIPTLTKRMLSGVRELEVQVMPRVFLTDHAGPESVAPLVKLCDLADAIRFIRIYGIGAEAAWARQGLEQQMGDLFRAAEDVWPEHVFVRVLHAIYEYMGA